jgi:hypothetical protein
MLPRPVFDQAALRFSTVEVRARSNRPGRSRRRR